MKCEECGSDRIIPNEPPIGTWVKDRYGGTHYRNPDGWAAAPQGFYSGGKWEAMWVARGPLTECGPWGEPTPCIICRALGVGVFDPNHFCPTCSTPPENVETST